MNCDLCGAFLDDAGNHLNSSKSSWLVDGVTFRPKLYRVWCNMRARCNYEKHKGYPYYGARGITVCDEWDNYEAFRRWCMENGWRVGLQIDRIDNDGNYEPSNCRLVTRHQNQQNRRLPTRHRTGKRYGRRFLSEEDVYMIRDSKLPNKTLADILDVHNSTISNIKRRKQWSHLPERTTDARRQKTRDAG